MCENKNLNEEKLEEVTGGGDFVSISKKHTCARCKRYLTDCPYDMVHKRAVMELKRSCSGFVARSAADI